MPTLMPSTALVAIAAPTIGFLGPRFAERYEVCNLWEADSVQLSQVRVLVAGGPFPVSAEIIDQLPSLGLIAYMTAGYDSLDIVHARRRGIALSHVPGASTEDVADHALTLLLASLRRLVESDRLLRAGAWVAGPPLGLRSFASVRVGIVGLGRIGSAVARRCAALRMSVAWHGPNPKPDAAWPRAPDLRALAEQSDALVLTARGQPGAAPLVGSETLAALGSDGVLINVGRGGLLDEKALRSALVNGRLAAAGLDVFAKEPTAPALWRDVPNLVLTPHVAGATPETIDAMVEMALGNIDLFLAGRALATPIRESSPLEG